MKYKDENQLMEKLGIDTWRNLSKDKVTQFASMMPDMDKEMMSKVIEQFPEFTKFGKNILESLNESIGKLTESNSKDSKEHLKIIIETQSALDKQLNKEDIDSHERMHIMDNMIKIAEMVKDMDQNNKSLLEKFNTSHFKTTTMLTVAALTMLGARVFLSQFIDE